MPSSLDFSLTQPGEACTSSLSHLSQLFPILPSLFIRSSPRQLLQSDTGVRHFAIDLLTHGLSPEFLSRCRPC